MDRNTAFYFIYHLALKQESCFNDNDNLIDQNIFRIRYMHIISQPEN